MILTASSCPRATCWECGSHGKPYFQQELLPPQMSVPDCSNIQEWRLLPCNYCVCTLGTKSGFRNSGIKFSTSSYRLTPRGFFICSWNTPRAHSAVIGQSCWIFFFMYKKSEKRITPIPPFLVAWHGNLEILWGLWKKTCYHSGKKMNEEIQTQKLCLFIS